MTDTRDDRQLIADVLDEPDSTCATCECSIRRTGNRCPDCTVTKLLRERSLNAAAPELARRLAALLDALDEETRSDPNCRDGDCPETACVKVRDIRAAYARNLERSKP